MKTNCPSFLTDARAILVSPLCVHSNLTPMTSVVRSLTVDPIHRPSMDPSPPHLMHWTSSPSEHITASPVQDGSQEPSTPPRSEDAVSLSPNQYLYFSCCRLLAVYTDVCVEFTGVCIYNGNIYNQGQSWDDGCKYVCTCENANAGVYRCTSKWVHFEN